jgi:hypothetical protein
LWWGNPKTENGGENKKFGFSGVSHNAAPARNFSNSIFSTGCGLAG